MAEFPGLDDLVTRIEALEFTIQAPLALSALTSRVSALESAINVPVNPIKVTQLYEDDTEIVYEKI